jgi:hypothetical protein
MKSILIGLTLLSWIVSFPGYTQTDSIYCLPLSKGRLLVADALKLRLADSLAQQFSSRIELMEALQAAQYNSFTNLLKHAETKYEKQKEITSDMERWGNSWRDQAEYYRKRERKQRRQKKVLTIAVVAVITLTLTK